MVRALVVALLVANLCFFAWTEGWLDRVVGTSARAEREPERLKRQVRPESIRVVPPGSPMPGASAVKTAAAAPLACLESAPLTTAQATAAEAALRAVQPPLPDASWTDVVTTPPAAGWLVYMGRYATPELLARKEDELRRRHLDFEVVESPAALAPGLSLGRYDDRPAADRALAGFAGQGIHTARVVQAAAPAATHVLRFAAVDPRVAAQLAPLRGNAFGDGFSPCAKPASVGTP